jgi:hypothetical protein
MARLKLARASLHLDTLKYEVLRFRQGNPYHIVQDIDPQTSKQRVYCVIDRHPDQGMALLLGDLANNLHSALDQAVFQLSLHFTSGSICGKQRASIGFPVACDPKQWTGGGEGKVRFLPTAYIDAIREEQPYVARQGVACSDHPLAVLHAIWNADKHRGIVPQSAWADMMALPVTYRHAWANYEWGPPVIDYGSDVLYSDRPFDSEEYADVFGYIEITLEKGGIPGNEISPGRPVIEIATSMYECVGSILTKLDEGALRIWPREEVPHSGWDRWERYIPKPGEPPPQITGSLVPGT